MEAVEKYRFIVSGLVNLEITKSKSYP